MTSPSPPLRRRPRPRVLLGAVGATTLLHWCLLSGSDGPSPSLGDGPIPAAVEVRTLEAASPAAADELPPAALAAPLAQAPAVAAPPARARPTRAARAAEALAPPVEDAGAVHPTGEVIAPAALEAAPEILMVAAGPTVSGADEPIPVYRTKVPPPATLHYALQRGMFAGTGELSWKPAGERYELRLEGRIAGVHVLTETSAGLVDAHGIAPLRFTDKRVRRGTSAANFQRDKGKITYSGPQAQYPLLPGSQDRLSWMLQLAAVIQAEPARALPGSRVVFFVSGAHGDADVWVFRSAGAEAVSTGAGSVDAVKFTREPRKAYDRTVEVWLAPARSHLPVRARFTTSGSGEVFELLLRDMQFP